MDQRRFEADEISDVKSSKCAEVSFVKKASAALGAGIFAMFAVGAVGIYAFAGRNSIDEGVSSEIVSTENVETETTVIASAEDQQTIETTAEPAAVSQAVTTWKKAGIDEYDLVIETVKATKKTKKKKTETTTTTTTASSVTAEEVETTAQEQKPLIQSAAASDSDEQTEVKTCAAMIMYTSEKVNMRTAPSLDAEIMQVLGQDEEVTVTGYTDDWYRIKFNGDTGYCMKRYLAQKSEEPEETEETVSVQNAGTIAYSDAEFEMLCYVLQGEVGDCSEESKIAVANVIINRVKSDSFPNSIEGVLTQADQFTAIYGYYGGYNQPTENTRDCARRALSGEDNSNGAIYYYAPNYCGGSTASWFESLTFCTQIDGQRYFK